MFNDSGSVEDLSAQHLAQGLATLPSLPDSSLEMQSPGLTADLLQIRVCFVAGSSIDSNAHCFFCLFLIILSCTIFGLPWGLRQERIHLQCRTSGFNPRTGDPLEQGGHGHPLQYSCPENSMDRRAWWPTDHGVAKSLTRLSD